MAYSRSNSDETKLDPNQDDTVGFIGYSSIKSLNNTAIFCSLFVHEKGRLQERKTLENQTISSVLMFPWVSTGFKYFGITRFTANKMCTTMADSAKEEASLLRNFLPWSFATLTLLSLVLTQKS